MNLLLLLALFLAPSLTPTPVMGLPISVAGSSIHFSAWTT